MHYTLSPDDPSNKAIVDLQHAPRDAAGLVRFESDSFILAPKDLTKGNGALVYDVNNRGNKLALRFFNDAPSSNNPTDAGNGYSCDWADWGEPMLVGPAGQKRLTELKWTAAGAAWGQVRVDKNAGGGPLRIDGKEVKFGIGTHANSLIGFRLPEGYDRLVARGGLDNGGTDQGACGDQYRCRDVDYEHLGDWCRSREGQVIVCEQQGADWLPFEALGNFKGRRGRSQEASWTSP